MLPDWLNAETLRQATVVVMFILAIFGLIVWRMVRAVVTRMIYLGVIAAMIGALWLQRDELRECQQTCSCSLFGQEVSVPDARLPSILDAGESGLGACDTTSSQ